MPLYKNVASQKVAVYAHDTANDAAKTGDQANITAYISKDGAAAVQSNDVNPSQIDATNMPGIYIFDLTQAESNCNLFTLVAKSATADVQLDPVMIYTSEQGLTTQQKTDVNTECDTALSDIKLDHLLAVADNDDVVDNSVIAKLADNTFGTADWSNFNNNMHALKAVLERGDEAWRTGSGASGSATYTTTNWTRTEGDNDGGVGSDTQTVDGNYFSTGETNAGTYLEVDGVFTVTDSELGVSVDLWAFYNGGGSHYMEVQARNFNDSTWEPLGNITTGSVIQKHSFNLSPDHTNISTEQIWIKLIHRGGSGVPSHVLSIDKCSVNTAVPVSTDVNITQWDGNAVTGDGDWAELQADVDAILVDTDATIPGLIAALNDISANDILTANMTESYAAQGIARTLTTILHNIEALLSRFSWSATALTTKKQDDSVAKTYTSNDAVNPTELDETT